MIRLPDFIVQATISEALQELADNPSVIDDLFSDFEESYLSSVFGKKEINSIKDYLKKKQIRVVTGWRPNDDEFPCYSVNLVGSQEIEGEALLDDFGQEVYLDAGGEVVDKTTSRLDYPESIPDHDSKSDEYSIPVQETVQIGCHALDFPNLGRYLAWLLHYILRSKKNTLISRGLERLSISFSDFNRMNEYMPEHVFSRFATLNCVHYLTFKEDDLLLSDTDGLEVQIKAQNFESDISPGTTEKGEDTDTVVTLDGSTD